QHRGSRSWSRGSADCHCGWSVHRDSCGDCIQLLFDTDPADRFPSGNIQCGISQLAKDPPETGRGARVIFETRRRRFLAEINVIPLVDVVLVLLVIFMVTAPMLYRGLDIKLPTSASNTIRPEERIVLTIERDQKLYIDKDPVSVEQLERRLRAMKERNADLSVYLRADREVPYGTVVQVMDGVKRSGIEKLGMVTEPAGRERVTEELIQQGVRRKGVQ